MRFRREIEAARRLQHPNLVAAQDADEDRGVHFLVMDYIEGRDLDRIVRERGPLHDFQAIDYLAQAARGLGAAHAQGIIHRDIKPGNLMLDSSGKVHVLDVGLARIVDAQNPFNKSAVDRLTQSGVYMGTVDFMAPEQAEDPHHVDQRADIYSLGCTLFYFLTGRAPFPGETIIKRMMAHIQRPAPSLREARPDVSIGLDNAYQKMMAKRPEDRPASMTEVISLLQGSRHPAGHVVGTVAPPAKSPPALTVHNETLPERAGPPETEADSSIFIRPVALEGGLFDQSRLVDSRGQAARRLRSWIPKPYNRSHGSYRLPGLSESRKRLLVQEHRAHRCNASLALMTSLTRRFALPRSCNADEDRKALTWTQ